MTSEQILSLPRGATLRFTHPTQPTQPCGTCLLLETEGTLVIVQFDDRAAPTTFRADNPEWTPFLSVVESDPAICEAHWQEFAAQCESAAEERGMIGDY